MADANRVTVDVTTGIGVLSFPRVFKTTVGTNDAGEKVYDLQFLIPKTDRETVKAILVAIKKVAIAKWGEENWRQVRNPLRDGDKEAKMLTEDGSTRGDKYPERTGHYFINCRSKKPVAVVARDRTPIVDEAEIYPGVKAKVNISFYPYSNSGNHGVGAGLNGVQKISDGEAIGGGGKPAVESMFDLLDDEADLDLDADLDADEAPEEKPPAKKAAAKRPAKKAAAKKPEPEPEPEDDFADLEADEADEEDLYADLDEEI